MKRILIAMLALSLLLGGCAHRAGANSEGGCFALRLDQAAALLPGRREIARWAATHLSAAERHDSTVYTSGEHCPMCSAAHARVGLGRIVYATSSAQLTAWHQDWGIAPGPVPSLPISAIAPHVEAHGPVQEFEQEIRTLHARLHGISLPE